MTDIPRVQWLHISDLHFKAEDSFDRHVIAEALLGSLPDLAKRGLKPDLIFVTGDIANSGKKDEYAHATVFFDKVLSTTGVDKGNLFVIPGNHDVDRKAGKFLLRTLRSAHDADDYYDPRSEKPHISSKLKNFVDWHDEYFLGIRKFSIQGVVAFSDLRIAGGVKLAINGLNSAVFCQDDHDHGKLWLGRRCLSALPPKVDQPDTFAVSLVHHPLDWTHEDERSVVTELLRSRSDFILRGHLHENDVEQVAGVSEASLHLAAGATYQTEKYPNRALFAALDADGLTVTPIRYESRPKAVWTVDSSMFPTSSDFSKTVQHARRLVHSVPTGSPPQSQTRTNGAKEAFEQDLFVTGSNARLYAEPRLMDRPHEQAASDDDGPARIPIDEIVQSQASYLIEAPSEYGGTSLARRIRYEIERHGSAKADLYDASKLPSYRKKLQDIFGSETKGSRTLILDNFDFGVHERLLKEVNGLGVFDRLIVIVSDKGLRQTSVVISDLEELKFERVFLWALGRQEIRVLAGGIFDTSDESLITSVVDKVYGDLLALCIPLTPSNVLMYLRVLNREDDFYPLNRVDILDRYLTELIRRPSDNTTSSFDARSKLNLISQFVYRMFADGDDYFTRSNWLKFCKDYKAAKLCDFDEDALIDDLIKARVIGGTKTGYWLKYSFFYNYFVGRHLANNRISLDSFISTKSFYNLPGAVEAVSGLLPDNTELLTSLCDELDAQLQRYFTEYMKEAFDPFSDAIWIDRASPEEADKFWQPIEKSIESGPRKPEEIDLLKTSMISEARTTDQQVRFEKFAELEDNIFLMSHVLADALKCSDSVDGALKKRAISLYYKTSLVVIQIGALLSHVIAENRYVRWGGLTFVNDSAKERGTAEHSDILGVLRQLCKVVSKRTSDTVGVVKLGEAFKALDHEVPAESFAKLQSFGSILSSKPDGWPEKLRKILEEADRKGYYFMQMLFHLLDSFKNDVHTTAERQTLKSLIAYVRTKRELKIDAPGKKVVTTILGRLEERGHFEPSNSKPE